MNNEIATTLERFLDPNCAWGDNWREVVLKAIIELRKNNYENGVRDSISIIEDCRGLLDNEEKMELIGKIFTLITSKLKS